MVKIVDLTLKAVIDSFKIYTKNSLIKKKFREWFHYVQALFAIVQQKQTKK